MQRDWSLASMETLAPKHVEVTQAVNTIFKLMPRHLLIGELITSKWMDAIPLPLNMKMVSWALKVY